MTNRVANAAAGDLAAAVRQVAIAVADLVAQPPSAACARGAGDEQLADGAHGRRATSARDVEETAESEAGALAGAPPLLFRLEQSIRFGNEEGEHLLPRLGASAEVGAGLRGRKEVGKRTVWLSAQAWDGIATLVTQTPDRHRIEVAAFLEALHSCVRPAAPVSGLLAEVIDELKANPYSDKQQADRDDFDFEW